MSTLRFIGPGLLLLLLMACSQATLPPPAAPCPDGCPAEEVCDEELGECVTPSPPGRGVADLAPGFDVATVGKVAGAVAYDRLHRRLLYGHLDPTTDAQFDWQTVLTELDDEPSLALVGTLSGPVIFVGEPAGDILRGKDPGTGWQWETLTSLANGLTSIDALLVPDVGYHIVATTADLETVFVEQHGGSVTGPEAVVDAAGDTLVEPPLTLVRIAGRTTLLGRGAGGGLISLTRESQGWTPHPLVDEVDVAGVAMLQTSFGVLTVYLDGADGGLYQVIEDEFGDVSVTELAAGARSSSSIGLPVRIGLAVSAERSFVLYHDVVNLEVRLLQSEAGWSWREEASRFQQTPLLPALVSIPDYEPLPVGLDLGDGGYGPGVFKVLF